MCFNRSTLSCLVLHTVIFYSCFCKLCGQETICTYTPNNRIKASIHYCLHFPRAVSAHTWLKPINHHRFPSVLPWNGCNFLFKAENMSGFSSRYSFHCNYAVITHIKQSKTERYVRVVQLLVKLTVEQLKHLGLWTIWVVNTCIFRVKTSWKHTKYWNGLYWMYGMNSYRNCWMAQIMIWILIAIFSYFSAQTCSKCFLHFSSVTFSLGFSLSRRLKTCSVHFLHVSNTYVWFLCFCSTMIFGRKKSKELYAS